MRDTLTRALGALAILLGLASLTLLAVAVWGFRAGGWPWPQAYDLAGWGVWAAGAGVASALAGLSVWLRHRRGGLGAALLGVILSLPVAGLGAAFEIAARTTPPIDDISTDTEDPPVFWFTATPSDYPMQNAEPQRAAYPEVLPLDLPLSGDEAFAAALAFMEERGWEVLSADLAESQIEAIATSRSSASRARWRSVSPRQIPAPASTCARARAWARSTAAPMPGASKPSSPISKRAPRTEERR
jgi:hypothetical protein